MMTVVLVVIGIIAGIIAGAAYGFAITYANINKHNTIADEGNPELAPEPPTPLGGRIFTAALGLIFFALGAWLTYFGISHMGMSGSEIAAATSGVKRAADAGTLVVAGAFALIIGGLVATASIFDK